MPEVEQAQFEALATAARRAAGHGLMQCSSGNLSCRAGDEHLLIKASRAWMCELTAAQVSLCRLADGALVQGPRPSVEIGFHAGILRSRPDVSVVLHFQSPAATTLACRRPELVNFHVIAEIPYYIGEIAIVPFINPGSPALAEAVTQALQRCNLAVLKNHGLVTVGQSFDEAIQRAVFFELACRVIVEGGNGVEPLAPGAVAKLKSGGGNA
jgi:ribulose-5-phosphate 4-epimerase/fuculose-1-phosphate aldolase